MDAIKFIEERNRMCKSFDVSCEECPAFDACKDDPCCAVRNMSTLDATAQIAIIEKWSAEHPRKTRQDVFLEQYRETALDEHGVITICPVTLSKAHRNSSGGCKNPYDRCDVCRREFWMQEVE